MVAVISLALAAAGAVGLTQASPLDARQTVPYKTYKGDGTVAQGWPAVSTWASFETM